jgi:hypothetical protein
LSHSEFLSQNLQCVTNYVISNELLSLSLLVAFVSMFMSPQIINSDFGLYRYFRVASSLFRDWIRSHEGALYKPNIRLAILVSSWFAQISKFCSLQWWEILVFLKHRSFLTKIHTPPLCIFFNWYLISNQQFWGAAGQKTDEQLSYTYCRVFIPCDVTFCQHVDYNMPLCDWYFLYLRASFILFMAVETIFSYSSVHLYVFGSTPESLN